MSNFDCKSMHDKCKAMCCGVFPVPKDIYERNQKNIVTYPHEVIDNHDTIIPLTKGGNCCFLNEDLSCNIYNDRPELCRRFGDESHPLLCCPYLDKSGKKRCRQSKRRVERETTTIINKFKIL